jgi:hypothetical protein
LRDVPGVNILGSGAKGTNMGQEVILLNGDSRVLVLIDGRRVNIASSGNYSADWLPPIDTIERIEVLKGAGSALYGTDAVGGVINVILKKALLCLNRSKYRPQPAPGPPSSMEVVPAAAETDWGYSSTPAKTEEAIIPTRTAKAAM